MEAKTVKKKNMWGGGQTHFLELNKTQFLKRTLVILQETTYFIHRALKYMGLHLIMFQIRNYGTYYLKFEQHPNFTYFTPLYI
jgi:hypothetical protein